MTVSLSPQPRRVFVLGATGTIGRATVRALLRPGMRSSASSGRGPGSAVPSTRTTARAPRGSPPPLRGRRGRAALERDGFRGERFDALVSCLASRTGAPRTPGPSITRACSAWRPRSGRGHAGRAALGDLRPEAAARLPAREARVREGPDRSGLDLFDRPADRLLQVALRPGGARAAGPAFPPFGDGGLTACKPISDDDLGRFLADCLDDAPPRADPADRRPGPAITPSSRGASLRLLAAAAIPPGAARAARCDHRRARCRRPPVPAFAEKAELARIGRYYATESMLVLDPASGRYDAAATPSTGTETLFDFYARLVRAKPRSIAATTQCSDRRVRTIAAVKRQHWR